MRALFTAALAAFAIALAASPAAQAVSRGRCLPDDRQSPTCFIWNAKVTFVADGDTVDAAIQGAGTHRIRFTGINTPELRRYSRTPSNRRGECHAVEATAFLERMIKQSHYQVRLVAQHASSHSGPRLRRSVQVRIGGRWRDTGPILLRAGLALWLPNGAESAFNRSYSTIAQQTAPRGVGMYDTSSCGAGPEQGARLRVRLKWDADGSDHQNVNGEWIEIRNFGSAPVSIGGWTVHFSDSRRYHFRSGARVPAGGRVRLHIGHGRNTRTDYYWGFGHPIFDDHLGDGAYLFDPGGDLRAWMMYPCRFRCTDPLQGKVRLSAQPRGQSESVSIRNVSASTIDIDGYVLALPFHQYDFLGNATIGPGETMVVDVQGDPRNDTRLHKYYGFNRTMLADGGDVVRLQTYNDIVVGCTAWGRGRC